MSFYSLSILKRKYTESYKTNWQNLIMAPVDIIKDDPSLDLMD